MLALTPRLTTGLSSSSGGLRELVKHFLMTQKSIFCREIALSLKVLCAPSL